MDMLLGSPSMLTYDGLDSIAPSDDWLGKFSTKPPIKNGKLWLSQHLDSIGLRDNDKIDLASAIANAKANQHSKPAQVLKSNWIHLNNIFTSSSTRQEVAHNSQDPAQTLHASMQL